jgi:hypothetical protein
MYKEDRMIHFRVSQFPTISIFFCEHKWNKATYMQTMKQMIDIMSKSENNSITLYIKGSMNHQIKKAIPLKFYGWVIKDICRLHPFFKQKLKKTAIFAPDSSLKFFFDMLFKVYTPARPLKIFQNENVALHWLNK